MAHTHPQMHAWSQGSFQPCVPETARLHQASSLLRAAISRWMTLSLKGWLMGVMLRQVKSAPLPVHAGVNRRKLRGGNKQLKILVDMVGASLPIYRGIMELCMLKYRDSDKPFVGQQEADLCSLRSQLLMSLHDMGALDICQQVFICYPLPSHTRHRRCPQASSVTKYWKAISSPMCGSGVSFCLSDPIPLCHSDCNARPYPVVPSSCTRFADPAMQSRPCKIMAAVCHKEVIDLASCSLVTKTGQLESGCRRHVVQASPAVFA